MPRDGSHAPNPQKAADQRQKQDERARKWAAGMTSGTDRQLLNELADKLEVEGAELERGAK